MLLAGADLVDAVEKRERPQGGGRGGVVPSGRSAGYPASYDAANRAVVELGRLRRRLVVDVHFALGGWRRGTATPGWRRGARWGGVLLSLTVSPSWSG